MDTDRLPIMGQDRLDRYIEEAARVAGYADFGAVGCDLSSSEWWAAYTRQSLKEQAENDRVGEYLLTCARLAKQSGVIVPREYIIYDADSSEDFNRPGMIRLRGQLIAGRRITGVIIPTQGRLSMVTLHQLTFESESEHYAVQVVYGDAPSGKDWASQTTRLIQAQANALRVKSNRDNALAGNIGRILSGKVPAQRAPYGYRYCAERVIEPRTGKVRTVQAHWELDELGLDGEPLFQSPAWVIAQIFRWIGKEGRTLYWAANQLNQSGIRPSETELWRPAKISALVRRHCYMGQALYNANSMVPNPKKPLGDLTLGVKRTISRPKPEQEALQFTVPALVSEELWNQANANLTERGRGRGKQGQSIQALLRSRILCPSCGRPMIVRRGGRQQRVYYHCSAYFRKWLTPPCSYRTFIPGTWDDFIWYDVCRLLSDDAWIERQLASQTSQNDSAEKLIRLQQFKISQAASKIVRVQDGFEAGIYTAVEAKERITGHQATVAKAKEEISRIEQESSFAGNSADSLVTVQGELKALRDRNLDEATFEDKLDVIAKLGLKVHPSEDLKSIQVSCQLDLPRVWPKGTEVVQYKSEDERESQSECGIVMFGSPIITFQHQEMEVFFEVSLAHAPRTGVREQWHSDRFLGR